jgi:hypothetical protein
MWGTGDSMQFSWVKGFGLGRAIPNWLHFVIERGEVAAAKVAAVEGGSECPQGLKPKILKVA